MKEYDAIEHSISLIRKTIDRYLEHLSERKAIGDVDGVNHLLDLIEIEESYLDEYKEKYPEYFV
jgi:hypothetical protein